MLFYHTKFRGAEVGFRLKKKHYLPDKAA